MDMIPLHLIDRGDRPRKINPQALESLKESLTQAGQISPIVVQAGKVVRGILVDGYHLISGNHRLTAAEALGWETIRAEVLEADANPVHLELIEVDENLCRAELTPSEKASAIKKRKILWESLKEQGGNSGNLISTIRGPGRPQGFASSTAEVTGMSKQAINQHLRIADALGDDLERVQGTLLDTKASLTRLSGMSPEERDAEITAILSPPYPVTHPADTATPPPESLPKEKPPLSDNEVNKRKTIAFIKAFYKLTPDVQRSVWETLRVIFEHRKPT